jgi:hypothetical protein
MSAVAAFSIASSESIFIRAGVLNKSQVQSHPPVFDIRSSTSQMRESCNPCAEVRAARVVFLR